jgi:Phosphatase
MEGMDVIGSHASRLPVLDDRWTPRPYGRGELAAGLVAGRVAGPVRSHDLDNVRRNIRLLFEGDPDKQFGMMGLQSLSPDEVLELVERATGFRADGRLDGPVWVDPQLVLDACEAVGVRLAAAVEHGQRVILATGHPRGLDHLYIEVGRLLDERGVRILTPADGESWIDGDRGRRWIRYHEGLAMLTDDERPLHTHGDEVMARILAEERPDLVLADHGFAGAAIERGVEAISIADVNDPALVVARALGRTEIVVVMDDNVAADAYWPCFQAIAAHLP